MTVRIATIIIEPHLLVREALDSLMEGHAYRVTCAVGSIPEVGGPSVAGNAIKLVILGAQTVDDAVPGAAEIRKLWPESKIVLLYESASTDDSQKLLASEFDGCAPLFVSPDTLIKTLDVIMNGDARVIVMAGARRLSIQRAKTESLQQPRINEDGDHSISVESHPLRIAAAALSQNQITVNGGGPLHRPDHDVAQSRRIPRLSEREAQILDGLVKGHANKVIARTCGITEATVKVHMKSILRKIQVANRTQAAIWALEHGYSTDEIEDRLLKAAEA